MIRSGMSVEVCTYRLSVRGRPVGSQTLKRSERGRVAFLEARLQLQGSLGQGTITQSSRYHAERYHSHQFREETDGRGDQRVYDVAFDADDGLVVAARGRADRATMPYLRAYRDPLSLLAEIRTLTGTEPEVRRAWRIPMLGKDVVVQRGSDVTLDTPFGPRRARTFVLHPGGSAVYVDLEPPHHLLRMVQRMEDGVVDAVLVRVDEDDEMASLQVPSSESESGASR
nr:hypothetical protein [Trueperaceae bacterium]